MRIIRLAVLLCGAVFITTTGAQSYDGTTVPGLSGTSIVDTVCSLLETNCDIFPDDKMFMRRLAYVESGDGTHPKTFRSGYYGGIWQVN